MRNRSLCTLAALLLAACYNERTVPLVEPIALFATHEKAGGDTTEIRFADDEPFYIRSIPDLTLTNLFAISLGHGRRGAHSPTGGVIWTSNEFVTVQLAAQDAARFETLARLLDGRRMAVRWGDDVVCAPIVRSVIARGTLRIDMDTNNAATIRAHLERQNGAGAQP